MLTKDQREIYYTRQTQAPAPRPGRQSRRITHKLNHQLARAKRPPAPMIHSDAAASADHARLASLTAGIAKAFGLAAQTPPEERATGRKLWRHRNHGRRK